MVLRIRLYFFIPKSGRKYSHINFYDFAMTLTLQDDHLMVGAWTACGDRRSNFDGRLTGAGHVLVDWILKH